MFSPRVMGALALLFAISPAGCDMEVSSSSEPILGGTALSVGQFPTVVAIVIESGARGLCTGTLVAPDLVLTAAHCITPSILGYATQAQVTANTLVIIDSTQLGVNGSVVGVIDTIPWPGFTQPGDLDVGLVRLTSPRTDRTPTPINLNAADAPVGVTVTMVGYGISEVGNQGSAGTGFVLEGKVSTSCGGVGVSDANFLCFNQNDGTGKCSGDSGGPSFATIGGVQKVVGITSFGDQNCEFFGVDMRVDAASSFFTEFAPELVVASCEGDDDCEDATHFCDLTVGKCTPGPDAPGGFGAPCGEGEVDCLAGSLCGTGPDGMECSRVCTVDPNDCPTGFDCFAIGDDGGGACFRGGGGGCGCNFTGDGRGAGGAVLFLLAFILVGRRRRRIRS